jgi:ATP-binding cassette, subfamily A (ABC1), member 3
MMGLKDTSYFASWLLFHTMIVVIMSLVITGMLSINVFSNSNKFLIFLLAFFYGMSLFGFSICIVALLPTQRASATAASLLHVILYFLVFAIRDPDTAASVKIGMSIFPNVGMSFCIYNLYHFETDSTGLNFDNTTIYYNNVTYSGALLALVFDTFFYLFLGLYLDQVVPSQYGVAKKWYFLCTKSFWCQTRRRRL